MIPDTFEGSNSAEKWTFDFLRERLMPHDEWIVWHQPTAVRRTPDFILWSAHLGLLIIEVKGWTLNHISLVDPLAWTVVYRNGPEVQKNPLKQADAYLDLYRDALRKHPGFRNTEGEYLGHLKFPIASCVLFPNITRQDALTSELKDGLSSCRYLFRDDVDPDCSSTQGTEDIFRTLKQPFTGFLFPFSSMGAEEVSQLRAMMFPQARVERTGHRTARPESRRGLTTAVFSKARIPVAVPGTELSAIQLLQEELARIKSQLNHPRQVQVIVQQEPASVYAPPALREQHGNYPQRRKKWNVFRSKLMMFLTLLLFVWVTFAVRARLSSWDRTNILRRWDNAVIPAPEKKRAAHAARRGHHRRDPYATGSID